MLRVGLMQIPSLYPADLISNNFLISAQLHCIKGFMISFKCRTSPHMLFQNYEVNINKMKTLKK